MMDEASLQRVCGLAAALKHSAHLLLDQQHKLSLDTWTLSEVQAAFSLILEVEQHTNFHVLPPNHRLHPAIPHLQFIYDLLQKIPGLRLWARDGLPPGSGPLSVRCFRSVVRLEVVRVPITSIKALQTLRPSLCSLTVCRGLSSLEDLFVRCGADNAGEFAWESLQEAVLSHNTLHVLDPCLSLLPNIKVLDLSHCELRDASALSHLPYIKVLNLSHNQLAILPTLAPSAATSLTILAISHNFISHLAGLEEMRNLEDLDLRANLLSLLEVLGVLGALGQLHTLCLSDNPLTCHPDYRTRVVRMLSSRISDKEVILDGQPLTAQEHSDVGLSADLSSFSYSEDLLTSLSALPSPISSSLPTPASPSCPVFSLGPQDPDSLDSQPSSLVQGSLTSLSKSAGNGQPRKRSRKKRTRHIAITDPDCEEGDGEMEEGAEGGGPDVLIPSSVEVLPQPPPPSLAAPSPIQQASPPDTIAFAALTLKAGMSSPAPEQSDRLLEEILQSKPQSGTSASPSSLVKNAQSSDPEPSTQDGSKTEITVEEDKMEEKKGTENVNEGEENTEEARSPNTTLLESSFYKRGMDVSVASSGDITPPHSDSEEEDDGEIHRVLAQKELESKAKDEEEEVGTEGEKNEMLLEDVILAVTATQFKEKHSITTRTLYRWDLVTLESAETLVCEPWVRRLHLTFTTLRPAYKTRTYILAPEDFQSLQAVLSPILERNTLQALLHSAMVCLRCQAQFSRDLAQSSYGNALRCPNCGGGVVVRADSVDHPAVSTSSPHLSAQPPPLLPPGLSSTPTQMPPTQSDVILEEDAVSGRRYSEGLVPPPPAVVNSDARTPPSAPSPSPATPHKQDPPPTNMQESSSSGSMTGSVCTTYERPGSLTTSPLRTPAPHTLTSIPHNSTSMDTTYDSSSALYQTAESSMVGIMSSSPAHHTISPGTSPVLGSSCTSVDTVKNGNTFGPESMEGEKTHSSENVKTLQNKGVMTSMREEEGEEGQRYNLASWVQSLLHTLTGYYWVWWEEVPEAEGKVQRATNPIRYSYEDFSVVDHRLKLHCDVVLFHEQQEELLGLVKGVLLVKGGRREFQGLLVISNKKLYILEIVGPEDDAPQSWLELHSSHSLGEVSCLHSLYQRQGLAVSVLDSLILISLADPHRANCLFNFLSEVLDERGVSPDIEEASPAQEEALTRLVAEAVGVTPSAALPSVFAIVSLLMEGGCSESQFLVVTEADLVLFHADLNWYLPPSPPLSSSLTLNCTQKIANITAIEVGSASHISLQFQDEVTGRESSWDLHVASEVAACHIIQAVRTPWSHLFSVDLQEFIGVYRSMEGDVLTVTRVNVDSDEDDREDVSEAEAKKEKQPVEEDCHKRTKDWETKQGNRKNMCVGEVEGTNEIETNNEGVKKIWNDGTATCQEQESPSHIKLDDASEELKEDKEGRKEMVTWEPQKIDTEGRRDTDKWEQQRENAYTRIETGLWEPQKLGTATGKEMVKWELQKVDTQDRKEMNQWELQKVDTQSRRETDKWEPQKVDANRPKSSDDGWYQVAAVATKLRYDPKYPILGYSDRVPTLVTSPDKGTS